MLRPSESPFDERELSDERPPHVFVSNGPQLSRSIMVNGQPQAYLDHFAWPSIAACASLPATVMPTDRQVDGLPTGVQIIGPALEDHTTLCVAELIKTQLGGFVTPPAMLV